MIATELSDIYSFSTKSNLFLYKKLLFNNKEYAKIIGLLWQPDPINIPSIIDGLQVIGIDLNETQSDLPLVLFISRSLCGICLENIGHNYLYIETNYGSYLNEYNAFFCNFGDLCINESFENYNAQFKLFTKNDGLIKYCGNDVDVWLNVYAPRKNIKLKTLKISDINGLIDLNNELCSKFNSKKFLTINYDNRLNILGDFWPLNSSDQTLLIKSKNKYSSMSENEKHNAEFLIKSITNQSYQPKYIIYGRKVIDCNSNTTRYFQGLEIEIEKLFEFKSKKYNFQCALINDLMFNSKYVEIYGEKYIGIDNVPLNNIPSNIKNYIAYVATFDDPYCIEDSIEITPDYLRNNQKQDAKIIIFKDKIKQIASFSIDNFSSLEKIVFEKEVFQLDFNCIIRNKNLKEIHFTNMPKKYNQYCIMNNHKDLKIFIKNGQFKGFDYSFSNLLTISGFINIYEENNIKYCVVKYNNKQNVCILSINYNGIVNIPSQIKGLDVIAIAKHSIKTNKEVFVPSTIKFFDSECNAYAGAIVHLDKTTFQIVQNDTWKNNFVLID